MTDDVVFAPASNQDSTIVPEGRWRLELQRIEPAPPSTFSDDKSPRAKWVFHLYAELVETLPKGEQFYFNGDPYELFRHTSLKNSPRAYARKYAEALLGRPLAEGEIPSKAELIGRSMSAVISYDAGTIDPNQQVLNLSSLRPAAASAKPAPAAAQPATPQIAPDASDEDIDRALVISKIQKSLKRLTALDPDLGAQAKNAVDASGDLDEALLEDLNVLAEQISTAVRKAMED